jgi:hypothetical protein
LIYIEEDTLANNPIKNINIKRFFDVALLFKIMLFAED